MQPRATPDVPESLRPAIMPSLHRRTLPWPFWIKWFVFRLLEFVSEFRERPTREHRARPQQRVGPPPNPSVVHLWVFASTIGELTAVEPLLRRLTEELPLLKLLLLSDHGHYAESYLAKYPDASFAVVDHRSSTARHLARAAPPALFLIAEIPCVLSDAPCRLPFALALEAKRHGSPVCLVNGWLYGRSPACRIDRIEKWLFERDYLQLFDVINVQTEDIRKTLLAIGAREDRVFATGNIKFDSLAAVRWDVASAKSGELVRGILASRRPVVTAGSVTNVSEQTLLLDAFRSVVGLPSRPLLVLAPRYPDNAERMSILEELLSARGYRFAFKSHLESPELDDALECLVLDTLGDLRDFYAISALSYVGLNKNVLEPLTFGKRVFVSHGWDPTRPGFAVYKLLAEGGFISEIPHGQLANAIAAHLAGNQNSTSTNFRQSDEYHSLAGATQRCLVHLDPAIRRISEARRVSLVSGPPPEIDHDAARGGGLSRANK
jgi:3-deoxy-D-manno-octulosonic-acid transferase